MQGMGGVGAQTGSAIEVGHENHVAGVVDTTAVNPDVEPRKTGDLAAQSLEGMTHGLDRGRTIFWRIACDIPHDDVPNGTRGEKGSGHGRAPETDDLRGSRPRAPWSGILPVNINVINHVNQKTFLQVVQDRQIAELPLAKMHNYVNITVIDRKRP